MSEFMTLDKPEHIRSTLADHCPELVAPSGLVVGVPSIARWLGRSERAVYHLVESKDKKGNKLPPRIPGATKQNGRWVLNTALYLSHTFGGEGRAA